ncbi:PDZ domain-containing protein 8-like isoform X2 [Stylophora pistillata]|uniref:PDZ domain-containing protein 8-like isoform X2 n=1 Tax=Stylophora pistillata TaxID=50429 RepID=UPI000C043AB2|nr:PDZ domain-containing protein 8-like isoform X2 [Stylophora pistillata]
MFIAFILAFLIGVFSVLLLEAILLYKWWSSTGVDAPKLYPQRTKVTNPELIADYYKKDQATEPESCVCMNLLFAFLWREWRDTPQMKRYFLKKMNSEFTELIQGKAASKLIEQITIEELSLGTSLPVITGATIMKIETKDPKEVAKELDIALDLEYTGGCHMAIQVDLVFNKSVYVAVKLVSLKGRARLQLSRHPLSHWSFAFYEEPEVEFEAESQFEGKNFPQLTSLIISHLRKSLQKKHTLPSYKIRYSPFFPQVIPQDETQEVYVHNSSVTVGSLEVTVVGCTRLPELENGVSQYCSLSVDQLPWSQLVENKRAMWPTFEIEISRENNDISFGLTLNKEISEDELGKTIVINTIVTDSPAYNAGVMAKDILVAVDGKKIESLKQAAKMIKNKSRFTATVQRQPTRISQRVDRENPEDKQDGKTVVNFNNVALYNDSDSEDEFVNIVVPLFEGEDNEIARSAMKEMLSRTTEPRPRAEKKMKGRDQKLSAQLTRGSKQGSPASTQRTYTSQTTLEVNDKKVSFDKTPQPNGTDTASPKRPRKVSLTVMDGLDTRKTTLVSASADPVWNETFKFDIPTSNLQYLNVCIWSKSQEKNEKDIILGHVTIPLMDIALRCLSFTSKRHEECFVLVSPHSDRIISNQPYLRNHPGLKESLCCGDITLIFHHSPSLTDCDESILDKVESLNESAPKDESPEKDTLESLEPPTHQFILTQFYFPTRCSYCNKKVWTKVAFQCRTCAMICHKKCLRNCMGYTHCVKQQSKSAPDKKNGKQEESKDNMAESSAPDVEEASSESDYEPFATTSERSSDEDETESEARDDLVNGNVKKSGRTEGAAESDEDVSDKRNVKEEATAIMRASERVREAGRELFTNLPLEARKSKLEDMMNRLQVEIDEENETRTELYAQRSKIKERKQKVAIESLLAKSEERSQALAMLMLQYCAGYQSCVEAEELDSYHL